MDLIIGQIGFFELLIILVIPAIVWFYALVDLLSSKFADSNNKLIWALVIIFLNLLGAILYLVIGRKQKVT